MELIRIERAPQGLEYPIARESAAGQLADVTLILPGGEANLGEPITPAANDECESPDDVLSGLQDASPRAAVGEPYQSDGDG